MKLRITYDPPPIPLRQFDWSVIDDDTYSGDPGDAVGYGETRDEALTDFVEKKELFGYSEELGTPFDL